MIIANNSSFSDSYLHITGNNNRISGAHCNVHGNGNRITGAFATVVGNDNTVSGRCSIVSGNNNRVSGTGSTAVGNNNNVTNQIRGYDNYVVQAQGIDDDSDVFVHISNNYGIASQTLTNGATVTFNFNASNSRKRTRNSSAVGSAKRHKASLPEAIVNESDAAEGEKECSVCMQRSVKTSLKPCGHATLCVTCALQIGLTKCPLCKKKIKKIKRIYL